ncbi:serine/threonine protein kinase [Aquihabitans sp. G128]|uniref:serine/threonine-protein kinase n=1 Tax=Aquihabitans sp. G128 TaxID=2849779 RepID=UPI001C22F970|nr:serine/threonine-protein kinase [Aquihabitans sp. G128]QXC61378.1 serine/threonine protein kinase [Aquihabitans sp. G128]
MLLEPIGRGGMGRVWRGVRRADGSAVAVKVLRPELADDPEQVSRFLTERTALRSVVDPHVVRVHDLVVEGAVLAIVMDLVVGDDLRAVLRREGRLAPGEALPLLAGIARGLEAVHAAGIVHRDVKPENVLVPATPDPAAPGAPVRLTDFGIARVVDGAHLTRATQLVGTPDYVAPELAAGRQPSPAADVYALGIVAYELLVGRRPFVGSNPAAVLRGHLELAPQRPPDLDEDVWDVVERCLAKTPDRRPTAAALAHRFGVLAPTVAGHARLAPLPDVAPASAAVGAWATDAPVEAPAVPAALAVALPGSDEGAGDERLDTRAGVPLAEPPAPEADERARWPWVSALALAALVVLGVGWFTARRDTSSSADQGPTATTTTAKAAVQRPFALAIAVERRKEGGLVVQVPPTLSQPRFAESNAMQVQYGPEDASKDDPTIVRLDGRRGSGTDSPDGLALGTITKEGSDIIDTITLPDAPKTSCVFVFVYLTGPDPKPSEQGFDGKPPTRCAKAPA